MPAVPTNVIRWDRMQDGIYAVLAEAVAPAVVDWAYQGFSYDDDVTPDFVNLTVVGGPSPSIVQHAFGRPIRPYDLVTVTVNFANVGMRYVVRINDQSFYYDAITGDDVNDIRTGLLATLAAEPELTGFVAVATATPGEFTITPSAFGAVWSAEIWGAMAGTAVMSDDAALLTRTRKMVEISVECFSKGTAPWNGAWALAGRCEAALQAPDAAELLSTYGVALWGKGSAIDLSAIAGGEWETRVQFPVTVALQSVLVRPVDQIDTVYVNVDGSMPTLSTTLTVARP